MSTTVNVVAFITPAPGKKAKILEALLATAAKVQGNEPDALIYEFYWDESHGQFVFVEKYKNMEAVVAHQKQPYFSELQALGEAEGLLAGPIDARLVEHVGGFTR
ncbi:hypothetical protein BU16DRAFT_523780 [Lophium mytilinum]|uniref:ABM domain-containing protein n=1 Tax=Lophium mytilinum TaxID=390894 RepID=A0A6A6R4N5_9PEZI|nr:hypothetical protein BU16DRAFT_523780 [Lophium mytilinum]